MPSAPKDPVTGLTPLQDKFVRELILNGGNMSKAALDAGYEAGSAYTRGWELMQKPHVLAAVAKARRKLYQSMAVEALAWMKDAMTDESVPASVKANLATAVVDRAGDRHTEVIEITDSRTPSEIKDKLALLLGDDDEAEQPELRH